MTAFPPDHRPGHDAGSLRTGLLRAATIFGLLALIAGWMGIIGNAGTAVAVAKFLFFVCLLIFMLLLTLAIIVGKRLR